MRVPILPARDSGLSHRVKELTDLFFRSFSPRELSVLAMKKMRVPVSLLQMSKLRRLGIRIRKGDISKVKGRSKVKVAYGPTLPTWAPSLLFDKALSEALMIEGAELVPFFCDQSQLDECSVSLDKWRSGSFTADCRICAKSSKQLWIGSYPISIGKLNLVDSAKSHLSQLAELEIELLEKFVYRGIDLGTLARNLISNGNLSENPTLAADYRGKLLKHIQNLAHIVDETEKFIEAQSPKRWVLNDTSYGMWAAVSQVAVSHGIDVYNTYPVTKKRTVIGGESPAIDMDFQQEFSTFKKKVLSEVEESQIERWMAGDRDSVVSLSNVKPKLRDASSARKQGSGLAVLAANICWDAASLGKQKVFNSMINWVVETTKWYSERPNLELIVRTHPAETNPMLPETVETVSGAILQHFGELPQNVLISSGSDQQPWSELLDEKMPDLVLVNTSTAGLEAAVKGYSAVVTGAAPYRNTGFVEVPDDPQQYFSLLESLHKNPKRLDHAQVREARSFLSYYQFRFQTDFNVLQGNPPILSPTVNMELSNPDSSIRQLARKIITGGRPYSSTTWARNSEENDA